MKINQLFLLLLSFAIIGGCGSNKSRNYSDVAQKISDAESGISKISVSELHKISEQTGEYKIIDCRENEEFIEGHIPGAINIPRGLLEFSGKISNRRETMYVYSQTNNRGSLACRTLNLLKYKKVFLIDGGLLKWNESYPSLFEKGDGNIGKTPIPKVEDSGGCG